MKLTHVVLLTALFFTAFPAAAERSILRLAVTTTTDNTGLIEHLVPAFERTGPFDVHVLAGGTGRALKLLANGDVDVALTHASHLEQRLIDRGEAINRRPIMYNDFIIVGPRSDPVGVTGSASALAAFRKIDRGAVVFVSRGDESGTHVREQWLWRELQIEPNGERYLSTGQGMGKTLQIAGELDAYTLIDRGTWLRHANGSPLKVLFQGDEGLFNVYSVLSANPLEHPDTNERGAAALTAWLRSDDCIALVQGFRISEQTLFIPYLPLPLSR